MYKKILVNQLEDNILKDKDANDETSNENQIVYDNSKRWKDSIIENPNKSDYGNRKAEIIDYAIVDKKGNITTSLVKGEDFTIKMRIIFNHIIQDPIVAFTIRDSKGTEITGTNTMLENIKIEVEKENEIKTIEFKQKMDLQGGEYLLCLGCTGFSDGKFNVYNRLYEICNISVISSKNTVGFFDMNSKINVK